MTKEEAIEYLKELLPEHVHSWRMSQNIEAISMAIDALQDIKCEGCNNVRGCPNCVDGDQWAHLEEVEPVSEDLEQAADKYVFGFHPSIQRMCKECYINT